MAKLLKMVDPNVDWAETMVKLGLTKMKSVAPKVTTLTPTPIPPHITETHKKTISPQDTLKSNPPSLEVNEPSKIPLYVSHLSYYIPPINVSDGEGETEKVEGEEGVTVKAETEGETGEDRETEGEEKIVEEIDEGDKTGGVEDVKEAEGEKAEEVETTESETMEIANGGQGDASARLMTDDEFVELLREVRAGTTDKQKSYAKVYRECVEDLKEVLEKASKKRRLLTYEEVDEVIREVEAEEREKEKTVGMSESKNPEEIDGGYNPDSEAEAKK